MILLDGGRLNKKSLRIPLYCISTAGSNDKRKVLRVNIVDANVLMDEVHNG